MEKKKNFNQSPMGDAQVSGADLEWCSGTGIETGTADVDKPRSRLYYVGQYSVILSGPLKLE